MQADPKPPAPLADQEIATPSLPHQLGPYRLERVLGRGGMGVVYAAYDRRLERRVAVKRIRAGSDDDLHRRRRLRREARNTAQLAHPAIVQVFDLIEDEEGDWIVMEMVEGTTLAQVLEAGPLDVDSTLGIAHQIAEGLAAAHALGIVHRDLKVENVMIMPDGRAKILDFGIAKQLDFAVEGSRQRQPISKTGEVLGTSRTMAPEQARGVAVGPRSDLFSFGVLLYETLTGVSPFRAKTPVGSLARVVAHHPEPIDALDPEIPLALSKLVEHLLQKASELRPVSADEVAHELFELLETRRLDRRQRTSGDYADLEATIAATIEGRLEGVAATVGSTPRSSEADSGDRARPGDRAPRLPRRVVAVGTALVVLLLLAAAVAFRAPSPSVVGTELAGGVGRGLAADGDPLQLYDQGMELLRRIDRPENVDQAISIFRHLIERDGESAAAHAGLARAYWEKSRNASAGGEPVFLEQAETMAREAVRLDAYLADGWTAFGLVHYSRGRYDEAAEAFEQALELDPTLADAHYGLGKLAEARGQGEEAEAHYRKAIELRPVPLYCDTLGSLLYDQGRHDEAEAAFLQSLDLAPDNIYALRNLGGLYHAQDRVDEAAAILQRALRIRPNASLYSNLGTLFFSRGLYSKAATAFEDALRMDGAANRYIFWLNLADAQRQIPGKEAEAKKSYQVAFEILDDAIEAAPGDVRLLSRRAQARARAGRRDDALEDIARLRQQGTGSDLYSLFRLAVAEELCGDREAALADVATALHSGFPRSEVRYEPDLQALRSDPRHHHLLVTLDGDR